MFLDIALIMAAGYLATRLLKDRSQPTAPLPAAQPVYTHPERLVALVGTANAGKSSTGNGLLGRHEFPVGAVHGVTRAPSRTAFKFGYELVDTPGYLDSNSAANTPFDLKKAEIVIYVCTGQLLRPEYEELEKIATMQRQLNILGVGRRRRLLLYCNQRDVAAVKMTRADMAAQESELVNQVSSILHASAIAFGSAGSRVTGMPPQVSELARLIDSWISHTTTQ